MTTAKLKKTLDEIARFQIAADAWLNRLMEDEKNEFVTYNSKQGGALRRASLDLTRTLAEFRRA